MILKAGKRLGLQSPLFEHYKKMVTIFHSNARANYCPYVWFILEKKEIIGSKMYKTHTVNNIIDRKVKSTLHLLLQVLPIKNAT